MRRIIVFTYIGKCSLDMPGPSLVMNVEKVSWCWCDDGMITGPANDGNHLSRVFIACFGPLPFTIRPKFQSETKKDREKLVEKPYGLLQN